MIMKPTDKIKELQEQIRNEQKKIERCAHVFDEAKWDPEIVKVGYGGKYVGHGSDPWWEYDGYRDSETPRWSKTCAFCGMKVYTTKQKAVALEPDFN